MVYEHLKIIHELLTDEARLDALKKYIVVEKDKTAAVYDIYTLVILHRLNKLDPLLQNQITMRLRKQGLLMKYKTLPDLVSYYLLREAKHIFYPHFQNGLQRLKNHVSQLKIHLFNVYDNIEQIFFNYLTKIRLRIEKQQPFLLEEEIKKQLEEEIKTFDLKTEINKKNTLQTIISMMATFLKMYQILQQRLHDIRLIRQHLPHLKIHLYGARWDLIEEVRDIWQGKVENGKPLAEVYNSAKIALSISPEFTLHERNFEILASASFPLVRIDKTLTGETLVDYFGTTIATYETDAQLIEQIRYYVEHETKRQEMIVQARAIMEAQFSNVTVAQKTIDYVKQNLIL